MSVYRPCSGVAVPMGKETVVVGTWLGSANTGRGNTASQSSPTAGAGTQECKARPGHLSVPLSPADVLRFDNTYSFVHTKKISFTVEVLLPDKGMQKYDEELTPI